MKTKKLDKARAKAKAAEASVPKGKPANYPLTPWNRKASDQRAAEMPSLSKTMGLGDLPETTILRGQIVDAEGVSTNDKYARQQANPLVNFKSGGKIKVKKYQKGGTGPTGKLTPKEELDRLTMNELRRALGSAGVAGIPMGAGPAKYASKENRGMSSFAYDLPAMTTAAKKKGVYQTARAKAVAEWRKKYGQDAQ